MRSHTAIADLGIGLAGEPERRSPVGLSRKGPGPVWRPSTGELQDRRPEPLAPVIPHLFASDEGEGSGCDYARSSSTHISVGERSCKTGSSTASVPSIEIGAVGTQTIQKSRKRFPECGSGVSALSAVSRKRRGGIDF